MVGSSTGAGLGIAGGLRGGAADETNALDEMGSPLDGAEAELGPGLETRNDVPHLGQRIFSPVAGIRFSSIWYGALHPSHSTLTMIRKAPLSRS
jgi:hypothetical protein